MSELYDILKKTIVIRGIITPHSAAMQFLTGLHLDVSVKKRGKLFTVKPAESSSKRRILWAFYNVDIPFRIGSPHGQIYGLTEEQAQRRNQNEEWGWGISKEMSPREVIVIREGGTWDKSDFGPAHPQLLQVLSRILGFLDASKDEYPVSIADRLCSYIMRMDRVVDKSIGGQLLK